MLDGRIDDPDPFGHRDAPPYRLGRDRTADGQEDVRTPAQVALDADIGRAAGPGLELMEGEAMKGVHDMRRTGPLGRQPAQCPGLGAVRVDYVVAAVRQLPGERAQGPAITGRG